MNKVKTLLLADKDSATIVKLSEGENNVGLNLKDVISTIIDAFPSDFKVDLSEKTKNDAREVRDVPDSNKQFMDANKDAIDNGIKKAFAPYSKKNKKNKNDAGDVQ